MNEALFKADLYGKLGVAKRALDWIDCFLLGNIDDIDGQAKGRLEGIITKVSELHHELEKEVAELSSDFNNDQAAYLNKRWILASYIALDREMVNSTYVQSQTVSRIAGDVGLGPEAYRLFNKQKYRVLKANKQIKKVIANFRKSMRKQPGI